MEKRISKIIEYKKLNSSQFAEEIGVQRSSISHILSGRNKPSLDLVLKILERFPEIEQNWLLFGKGEMLKEYDLFSNVAEKSANTKEKEDDNVRNRENEDNQDAPTDFIDIVSKNLFNSQSTSTNNSKESSNIDKKREDDLPSSGIDIERIVVFYKNGKFKNYEPF